MHGALNRIPLTRSFADPAGDATKVVGRVPEGGGKWTLANGSVALGATFDADGSNHVAYTLYKNGVDGAATPVAITDTIGGASVDWTANVVKEFTPVAGVTLVPGEVITVVHNETGTVGPGEPTVMLELVRGVATTD